MNYGRVVPEEARQEEEGKLLGPDSREQTAKRFTSTPRETKSE